MGISGHSSDLSVSPSDILCTLIHSHFTASAVFQQGGIAALLKYSTRSLGCLLCRRSLFPVLRRAVSECTVGLLTFILWPLWFFLGPRRERSLFVHPRWNTCTFQNSLRYLMLTPFERKERSRHDTVPCPKLCTPLCTHVSV